MSDAASFGTQVLVNRVVVPGCVSRITIGADKQRVRKAEGTAMFPMSGPATIGKREPAPVRLHLWTDRSRASSPWMCLIEGTVAETFVLRRIDRADSEALLAVAGGQGAWRIDCTRPLEPGHYLVAARMDMCHFTIPDDASAYAQTADRTRVVNLLVRAGRKDQRGSNASDPFDRRAIDAVTRANLCAVWDALSTDTSPIEFRRAQSVLKDGGDIALVMDFDARTGAFGRGRHVYYATSALGFETEISFAPRLVVTVAAHGHIYANLLDACEGREIGADERILLSGVQPRSRTGVFSEYAHDLQSVAAERTR